MQCQYLALLPAAGESAGQVPLQNATDRKKRCKMQRPCCRMQQFPLQNATLSDRVNFEWLYHAGILHGKPQIFLLQASQKCDHSGSTFAPRHRRGLAEGHPLTPHRLPPVFRFAESVNCSSFSACKMDLFVSMSGSALDAGCCVLLRGKYPVLSETRPALPRCEVHGAEPATLRQNRHRLYDPVGENDVTRLAFLHTSVLPPDCSPCTLSPELAAPTAGSENPQSRHRTQQAELHGCTRCRFQTY